MIKVIKQYFFIFLIIGIIAFLFTNCSNTKNYQTDSVYAPIFLNIKTIYSSQIAFNIGTTLPIKIFVGSKSYSIYPIILELKIASSYQYIIDPYTSFILGVDNQLYFPKLPDEVKNTPLYKLLLEKDKKLLILSPYPKTINLLYFLSSDVSSKKLKLICNINGKIYFFEL